MHTHIAGQQISMHPKHVLATNYMHAAVGTHISTHMHQGHSFIHMYTQTWDQGRQMCTYTHACTLSVNNTHSSPAVNP